MGRSVDSHSNFSGNYSPLAGSVIRMTTYPPFEMHSLIVSLAF
jgi:hypothetical protein